jgi:putative sigma-54 modulation protein
MQVNITFRNMFATDALRNHVETKLQHMVAKYLDKVTEVHVTLSLERYLHHADLNLHAGTFHVRGKEKSEDMYASIDMAVDKIERQLKKYKERIKSHKPRHHENGTKHQPVRVRHEILANHDGEPLGAQVIRSSEFQAKPMSIEEAVMQMDLLNNDFLVFTRPDTNEVSVVYRRKDGNYGVIHPNEGGEAILPKDAKRSAPQAET